MYILWVYLLKLMGGVKNTVFCAVDYYVYSAIFSQGSIAEDI